MALNAQGGEVFAFLLVKYPGIRLHWYTDGLMLIRLKCVWYFNLVNLVSMCLCL